MKRNLLFTFTTFSLFILLSNNGMAQYINSADNYMCERNNINYSNPRYSPNNKTIEGDFLQDSIQVIRAKDTVRRRSVWYKIYHYFADANKKSNKKFDISFIGGPHYSSDIKLGLGLVAAGLYSSNRQDSLTPISNVSLTGDITTTGFYLIGIRGNHVAYREKWSIDYGAYFYSFPSAFWGLGYEAGDDNLNASRYLRVQSILKADFLFRIAHNLYIGPTVGFDFARGSKFSKPELIYGLKEKNYAFNYGIIISYDTRDFIPNAYKGMYLKILQRNYTDFSDKPFFKTTLQYNLYHSAWKGAVFAYDFMGELGYGNTPWTFMSPIGGSYRMRGYYEGRYRDDNMITLQFEIRQKIYNRHGVTLWGGVGNVWGKSNAFAWKHTLPNYGIGYRWEFKKRVNIRLDYGFGKKGQSSFIFGINEAF